MDHQFGLHKLHFDNKLRELDVFDLPQEQKQAKIKTKRESEERERELFCQRRQRLTMAAQGSE